MEDGLSRERSVILSSLLRFLSAAGLIAFLPGVVAGVAEGLWLVVAVDVLAYAAVLVSAFSPRLGSTVKLSVLVLASLVTGAVVLAQTGALGAGYLWFVAAVVMSALFGDRRVMAITTGSSVAIMAAWIAALWLGADGHGATPVTVVIVSGSLFLICLALAMVIRRLLAAISAALAERGSLADSLAEELRRSNAIRRQLEDNLAVKEALLRELQHRVRNNLQSVLSLLALGEDSPGRGLPDAIRRIRILSVANDIFLSDPDRGSVDGRALIRAVAQLAAEGESDGYCGIESLGEEPIELEPRTATIAAVLVSDLMAGLARDGGVPDVRVDGSGGRLRVRLRPNERNGVDRALVSIFASVSAGRMAKGAEPEVRIALREGPGHGACIYLETSDAGR